MSGWDKARLRAKELRQEQTGAEKVLWDSLRNRRLHGLKFRRQHPIGPYIVDFYCAHCRLVVEVDGEIHDQQAEQDQLRSSQLVAYGFRVLRFKNQQVESDLETVLAEIVAECDASALLPGFLGEGQAGVRPGKNE